ncbi:hypothetical protein [Snodgrassella communis]|uniref:hypothetical protein n=1 Tax=Snodgrassella communis TaxID=2946699 RepID=UPI0005690D23|nr:hypothetical protein [Snodgrassella communis]
MKYMLSILRRLISFLILYLFMCLAQANEQNLVSDFIRDQKNICNSLENNAIVIALFPVYNNDIYLNGIYHGAIKKINMIIL